MIEPDPAPSDVDEEKEACVAPHEMDPEKVSPLASLLGCLCGRVLLVGCDRRTSVMTSFVVKD